MTSPSQGAPHTMTDDERADVQSALRIAASSLEQAALHFWPDDAEPIGDAAVDRAKIALRRQCARYRKLAGRLER
jgi:ethanolamine utilization microcompartment shell protein EutL